MTVATLGLGQFALLGHQQWREKPGVHAPQTKVHCLLFFCLVRLSQLIAVGHR